MGCMSNFKFNTPTNTPPGTIVCGCSTVPVQTVDASTQWQKDSTGDNFYQDFGSGYKVNAAIKTNGTLWLWGINSSGQLGNNSTINQSSLVQTVSGGTNWLQIAAGEPTAAIKTDGTLWLWGYNGNGQLGTNSTIGRSSPVQTISGGTNWSQVARSGPRFATAAVKSDGTLWLWGWGIEGMLGNNSTANQSSPVQTVSATTNWRQVSLSVNLGSTAAAIKTDGTLWIWGRGTEGQLGNGAGGWRSSPVQTISGGTNWKSVLINNSAIALKTDGTLWTWGNGAGGVLGNNSATNQASPVQTVSATTNWKQISLTSAVKTDGTLWTWGYANYGALGNNSLTNQSSPVQTSLATTDWNQVSVSGNGMAVKTDGTLWIWGDNRCGQLGINCVTGSPDITLDFDDAFVRKEWFTDGGLWIWGPGGGGRLGNDSSVARSSPVQTISGGTAWKSLSTYVSGAIVRSAAIKTDGTLWLWGSGSCGGLGNSLLSNRSSPVQTVSATTNWRQISVSCLTSAAIKTDGTLWMWGSGPSGQLGHNSSIAQSSPVQTVSATTDWQQVSVGAYHTAAIKTDGTLWSWGSGQSGQMGNESFTNRSSPVQTISGGTNWRLVSVGGGVTAAIKTNGTLWVWGISTYGEIGNNSTLDQGSPVQTVAGGTNWKQISASFSQTAAIKTDGTLWVWGYNYYGALGNNSLINQSSPVQTVSAATNWKQVSAGCNTITAIKTDGTLWLWGTGLGGRLGNNSTIYISSPIQTVAGGTTWFQTSGSAAIRENCW